jgi:DNA-binding response OmpR family regulator
MAGDRFLAGTAILVVEDAALVADDLSRELSDEGAIVLGPATTIGEAFAVLDARRPDLAVLDIDLGGTPVFPVADALAACGVPFLFATGLAAEALPDRFRDVPCFAKPVRLQAIIAALGVLQLSQAGDPGWTAPSDEQLPPTGTG